MMLDEQSIPGSQTQTLDQTTVGLSLSDFHGADPGDSLNYCVSRLIVRGARH